MSKNSIKISALAVIVAFLSTSLPAEECGEWCRRNWVLKEKNLVMPPEYAEKLKEYRDCIQQHLDQHELDTILGKVEDDQIYRDAEDACAEFEPTEGDHGEYELLEFDPMGRLVEAVTTDCFRAVAPDAVGGERALFPDKSWDKGKIPQYYFELTFETGLGGQEQFEHLGVMDQLRSRLTISLYYDGEQPELVKTWQTNSQSNKFGAHKGRMFARWYGVTDWHDGELRKDKPIENLCRDWERTPTTCQIKPEKEMVEEGEEIRVDLTAFTDSKGESSREFNRIVVQVNWGEILNGVQYQGNPKMAIYKVDDGSIEVQYRAPDTTALGADMMTVFSCCDVGKEALFPLAETQPCDRIAQQEIPIARPGVTALVTRKFTKTSDYTTTESNTTTTKSWTETSEITVSMTFTENPRVDVSFDPATMKMTPSRYVYELADYSIHSSNYSGAGSSEETVGSGAHIHRHVSASTSQTGAFQNLKPSNKEARLTITVDPATGKATEISIPSFDVTIDIASQVDCSGEKLVKGRLEPFDCSNSSQFTKDFPIQPLTSDRDKCLEISGGDGLTEIRGKCSEQKTTSQGSQEESYEWVIYKRD